LKERKCKGKEKGRGREGKGVFKKKGTYSEWARTFLPLEESCEWAVEVNGRESVV
jgi:hypothetical protein